MLLVALTLLVGAAAGAAYWFVIRDPTQAAARTDPSIDTVETPIGDGGSTGTGETSASTPTVDAVPPPAETPSALPTTPLVTVPPAVDHPGSPVQTPYWTVVVTSISEADGGRAAAEAVAAQLSALGYTPDIFHSDAHSALRPGYWVTATGRFGTKAEAQALRNRVDDDGFDASTPYARCIGEKSQCPES